MVRPSARAEPDSAVPKATPPVTQSPERQTVALPHGLAIGGDGFMVVAGPCAVESEEQLLTTARAVRDAGAGALRGGAFKPRTSPRSFQGLGELALRYLEEAGEETGLPVVTEVMDPRQVDLVADHSAMLQIGSRNMQNAPLLREAGRTGMPILLKRGAAATIDELLAAVDYIVETGNENIVLCERGLRSFDPSTRYTLDLAAVPVLRTRTPLPVVVDPSHGTGHRHLVVPLALAALAVGADGLLIEVHPDPAQALSDGPQALTPADFSALMDEIRRWIPPSGRYLSTVGQTAAS